MSESPSTRADLPLHVINVHLHDRPGAVHSVTDVFSARGLQIEVFQATSDSLSADGHASLLIQFHASQERATLITRVLRRLSSVRSAELLGACDARLVQSVLIAPPASTPTGIRAIALETTMALAIGSPEAMQRWLLSADAPRRLGAVRIDLLGTLPAT